RARHAGRGLRARTDGGFSTSGGLGLAPQVPDSGLIAVFRGSHLRADGPDSALFHGNGGIAAEPGTQNAGSGAERSDQVTMFTRHISRRLAAYIDGELAPRRSRQAEVHLERCTRCRVECEQVRFGMESLDYLPAVAPPAAVWAAIETALQERRSPEVAAP